MQGVSLNGIRKTAQKEAVAFDLKNRKAAALYYIGLFLHSMPRKECVCNRKAGMDIK